MKVSLNPSPREYDVEFAELILKIVDDDGEAMRSARRRGGLDFSGHTHPCVVFGINSLKCADSTRRCGPERCGLYNFNNKSLIEIIQWAKDTLCKSELVDIDIAMINPKAKWSLA